MEHKKRPVVTDNRTVDTSDDYAMDYWAQQLNTTKAKLLAAVAEAGDDFAAVKKHLKKP